MIGDPKPVELKHSHIHANVTSRYQVTTADGRPARLAIVDEHGNVIEAGDQVAAAAWEVCYGVYRNFWIGQGHLKVHRGPPGLYIHTAAPAEQTPRRRARG